MSALNIVLIVQLLLWGLTVMIFLGIRVMLKKAGLYKPKEKAKSAELRPAESKNPYQASKKKWRFDAAVVRSIGANIRQFSRKHRKALIACLIVVMALGSVVIATESRYGTKISGFNEIEIVEYRGNATSVEIPSRIYGMKVIRIGDDAFHNCSSLTSITIPNSVTSIGEYAFLGCSSLTSITIPDSVTSIGDYAFPDCISLTSITIGNGVTNIGDTAFSYCSSLTSITIPDSVTSIGEYAFEGCSSLTSITIPDSVTSIGGRAFEGCSSLTSITIPDSVTSIDYAAFLDCSSLTSVTIPNSVTSIGYGAFSGCRSLTSVTIPDSVTIIGHYAFEDCSSLTSVYYTGTSTQWDSITIDSYNSQLTSATRYYYSETQPTTSGNYWRYVDGVPTPW